MLFILQFLVLSQKPPTKLADACLMSRDDTNRPNNALDAIMRLDVMLEMIRAASPTWCLDDRAARALGGAMQVDKSIGDLVATHLHRRMDRTSGVACDLAISVDRIESVLDAMRRL
jgi:hypothetical protein